MRKDFPRNGPSGWYSKAWMSRADQSLSSSIPNTCASTSSIGTRSPRRLGAPTTTRELELDVELRARLPTRPRRRSATWPQRPHDLGARHGDRAGPAVVADGDVAPVGEQRLTFRPEQAAEVRRVVDARVHVDVVADRDGQQHLELAPVDDDVGIELAAPRTSATHVAHVAPRLRSEREEVVEVRPAEHVGRHADVDARDERVQIDRVVADRDEGTRLPAARAARHRTAGWRA